MKDGRFWLILILGSGFLDVRPILAHGVKITYQSTPAISIQALYDDGRPMGNAPVIIYAPQDPSQPWLKGTTDAQGKYTFTPDPNQAGNWEVKVRQAGHGDIISIPVGQAAAASQAASASEYTPLQKFLMVAATVWGFIGTALFFSRKKGT